MPAGAIQGGEVKHPDAVQQAIRQALVQGGVQATEAVIGVSGGSVIAKRVNLPKMSESELGESIRWEAEQHIPFDIDDVNIDFQILRQDGPQLEVMLVAVKKGKVQSYADVVEACGLNVVVVDVDVFALETQYQHNESGQGNEVVALVNIGHETTNTNIMQGGDQRLRARHLRRRPAVRVDDRPALRPGGPPRRRRSSGASRAR